MRTMFAALLATVALAAAAPAASASSLDQLTVRPSGPYGVCQGLDESCTSLEAGIGLSYTNDTTSVSASLTNLGDGGSVPIVYDRYPGGTELSPNFVFNVPIDTRSPLPAGSYQLSVILSTDGEWECSVHFEDGCHWFAGETDRLAWRFVYDGQSTSTYNLYVPPKPVTPKTKMLKAAIAKPGARRHPVKGRIASTAANGRTVVIKRHPVHGGKWRVVEVMRTNANGEFSGTAPAPGAKAYRWKIVVKAGGGAPAWSGTFGTF